MKTLPAVAFGLGGNDELDYADEKLNATIQKRNGSRTKSRALHLASQSFFLLRIRAVSKRLAVRKTALLQFLQVSRLETVF